MCVAALAMLAASILIASQLHISAALKVNWRGLCLVLFSLASQTITHKAQLVAVCQYDTRTHWHDLSKRVAACDLLTNPN